MLANYHTHTYRCHHASDEKERKYVETAIERGLEIMGFSDHAPYLFTRGTYYSGFRMYPYQLAQYCDTIMELREEYKNEIKILIGLEIEYYPEFFKNEMNWLKDYPIDYLIMGQHFIKNEIDGFLYSHGIEPNRKPTANEEYLKLYADQVIEGMHTGCFTYIAHPDIFTFTGDDEIYKKHMQRLCTEAKKLDIPLEYNLLGVGEKRTYPSDKFFEIAAATGNKVIIGCDAHIAQNVANPAVLAEAEANLQKLGITPLVYADIVNPFKSYKETT